MFDKPVSTILQEVVSEVLFCDVCSLGLQLKPKVGWLIFGRDVLDDVILHPDYVL